VRRAFALLTAAAVLGGCSGVKETTTTTATGGEDKVVVAALGDSITAGSPLWDPDEAVRAQLEAPDERSQYEYWAAREHSELEFRNCGVFGERTDEIAARLDDCADGADALIVQGGINDIAQGRSVEAAAGGLLGMVQQGKELGLEVAITDVLPWNNGHPQADRDIALLNRAIAEMAGIEGVPLLPFHDTLADRKEPGLMAPGLSDDGDHPSVAGYRLLGTRAFEPATRTIVP
jgi:lysophospholipase L1-like esterase